MSEYVRITERKIELTDEGVEALMSDYTPTTEEVKDSYVSMQVCLAYPNPDAEFDRWLAKVKREAVAEWQLERLAATIKATREGYNMGENK